MKSIDKDHVNRVVYEMSKGSRHFQHAEANDKRWVCRLAAVARCGDPTLFPIAGRLLTACCLAT